MSYINQLISLLGVGVISFALSLFIAREVGASHFGQYSMALAIGSILAITFDGGLRNLLTRERTKSSVHLSKFNDELPHIAMGHSLIAAIMASLVCLITLPDQIYLGLGIIWCFWGAVISQYASAILRGDGHLRSDSFWQLKQRALTAIFISFTIFFGYFEAWQLLLAWAAGTICANLFLKEGFRFKPLFKPLLSLDFKLYRALLPLLWIDLATTLYFRSDLIVLRSLEVSDNEVGQYAAAFRLIEAGILIASPISIIIFRKVRLLQGNLPSQAKYIVQSLFISALFGFAGLVLVEQFSNPLVQFTYGSQYAHAITLLPILGWMFILLIPNMVLTQTALALNLEKSYALSATFAAVGNIFLNLLFIPKYGTVAAAYSSIAAELILFIGLSYAILRKIKKY